MLDEDVNAHSKNYTNTRIIYILYTIKIPCKYSFYIMQLIMEVNNRLSTHVNYKNEILKND